MYVYMIAAITFSFYLDYHNPGRNGLSDCAICALCVEDLSYIHDEDPTSCLSSCVACEGNVGCKTYVVDSGSVTITVSSE